MSFDDLWRGQEGIVTHGQAIAAGLSPDAIRARLASGRWRTLFRGVYATFTGPISHRAAVFAALLAAGPDAVASHWTAGTLWGLIDADRRAIHVTIPSRRRSKALPGVVIHRSTRIGVARHPIRTPAVTRVEDTVLDLIELAGNPDDVVGLLSAAVGRKLTTADRLLAATLDRSRLKWRSVVSFALGDISDGTRSPLERHFYRDVERAHGLPRGDRQDPAVLDNGTRIYRDVRYRNFGVVVELDGRAAHPAEHRAHDFRRDNAAALDGDVVLHFGWDDVVRRPCLTAAQLTRALRNGGWQRLPRECSTMCKILEF